jgi:ComF family protein
MLRKVSDWLVPNLCICCQNSVFKSQAICQYCFEELSLFDPSQGNLLLQPDICRDFKLDNITSLIACGWYEGQLKQWLSGYKFHHQTRFQAALEQIIYHQWTRYQLNKDNMPDIAVIMPLHTTRLVNRGFNQVNQTWQNCIAPYLTPKIKLHRSFNTRPQSGLLFMQRKKNLRNAFEVTGSMTGVKVAIVDDVITTGATMNAAAQACLDAGALQVSAIATALTPLH